MENCTLRIAFIYGLVLGIYHFSEHKFGGVY